MVFLQDVGKTMEFLLEIRYNTIVKINERTGMFEIMKGGGNMKKMWMLSFVIVTAFSLIACKKSIDKDVYISDNQEQNQITSVAPTHEPDLSTDQVPPGDATGNSSGDHALESEILLDVNSNASYDLSEKSYFLDHTIRIYYPQIVHLTDETLQTKINEVLKNNAMRYVEGFDATEPKNRLQADYVITWTGGKLLSIQYIGYINLAASAYPNSFAYTTNINMLTGAEVSLSDMIKFDNSLQKLIMDKGTLKHQYFTEERDLMNDSTFEETDVIAEIENYLFQGDTPIEISQVDSYYTEDSLGLIFETIHAVGDYIQLEIKYKDIVNFMRQDQLLWKGFSEEMNSDRQKASINENEILKNINYLPRFSIIKEQSFWVDFENWGEVYFISASGEGDYNLDSLYLYLADENSNVLYEFPKFYGNVYQLSQVAAVGFRDLNRDGLKDVIVIARCITGIGPNGMEEFPMAGVYLQQEGKFINLPELDEELNSAGQNENIGMVTEYIKDKDIVID